MELYIQVSFWMGLIALILNLLVLMAADFPIVKKETIGLKTAQVFIGSAFVVWAGFLLYG